MLKFLTHKLRTHSLNEDNVSEKVGSCRPVVATEQLESANRRAEGRRARKWPPREQRSGTILDSPATTRRARRPQNSFRSFLTTSSGKRGTPWGLTGSKMTRLIEVSDAVLSPACVAGGGARLRHRVRRRSTALSR